MKSGRVVREFPTVNGHSAVPRTPRWEDLDDLLDLINSLVDEGADIYRNEKVTRDEEADWLSRLLVRLERDDTFFLVAEVDGRVVASSDIKRLKAYEAHVGVLGIVVKNGFRDIGIGTAIMRVPLEEAQRMSLKVLTLSAFSSNRRAIHVYEKVGFVQTSLIPKKHFKEGKYTDEVIMTKMLE